MIHGALISLDADKGSELVGDNPSILRRAYTEDGRFLGMIKYDPEVRQWHPEKIFLKEI